MQGRILWICIADVPLPFYHCWMLKPVAEEIIAQLRTRVPNGDPIDLLLIGPDLVAQGYSQDDIVFALDNLARQKQIAFAGRNRIRLVIA